MSSVTKSSSFLSENDPHGNIAEELTGDSSVGGFFGGAYVMHERG